MWLVLLTPSAKARDAGAKEVILTSQGNESKYLFREREIHWSAINKMMDEGLIDKVTIDYKPSPQLGIRRIHRTADGKFVQTRDNVICSPAFTERQHAWEYEP